MPNFFRIGQSTDGPQRNAGSSQRGLVTGFAAGKSYGTIRNDVNTKQRITQLQRDIHSRMVTADMQGPDVGGRGGLAAGGGAAAGGNFSSNRFTPPNEKLDRNTLLDDIIPTGDQAQINMFNRIYKEDAISGSATDLIATAPWSGWTLSGISDKSVMRIYEEAMEHFNPELAMPDITRDYLKHGRVIMSLAFDAELGTWKNFIPIDPLYCEIIPIPIYGFEPLVNMIKSPEIDMFLSTKDKRLSQALQAFPANILKQLKNGNKAELDPLQTLYLRRKTSMVDWKGTSIYLRILPYYALERALLTSTIAAARRRTRSILHITVGVDGQWEPTPEQLDDVITQFETSEEDPVGAIIATRSGIECNEVRSGGDFWKISEEADFLNASKLKALGVSESLMSGEATINNVDASRSMFVESEKLLRAKLSTETFTNKIFENLARAHNFVKRKHADVVHGVRTSTLAAAPLSVDDALSIPKSDLLIPTIHWEKTLSPESDQSYLDLLKSAKEEGLPITLKMVASAAGVDLDALEQTLPDDADMRKRFKKFMPKAPAEGEGEGGGGFGSFGSSSYYDHPVEIFAAMALGNIIQDDPNQQSVLGISYKELNTVVAMLTKDNRTQRMLRDDRELSGWLYSRFSGNPKKVEAARFLLTRMGFADCIIDTDYIQDVAVKLRDAATRNIGNNSVLGKIRDEVQILTTIYKYKSSRSKGDYKREQARLNADTRQLVASSIQSMPLAQARINRNIYAGV